jgi:hypothetical protein
MQTYYLGAPLSQFRQLLLLSIALLSIGCMRQSDQPDTQSKPADQSAPTPRRILRSEPVVVDDAKFQVVLGTQVAKAIKGSAGVPIDLTLHITNVGQKPLAFHTFDTIYVNLWDSFGQKVPIRAARDWTDLSRPIQLAPDGSYAIRFDPVLKVDQNGRAYIEYMDLTGEFVRHGPLASGKYTVAFLYDTSLSPNNVGLANPGRDRPFAFWHGKITTKTVPITIELD